MRNISKISAEGIKSGYNGLPDPAQCLEQKFTFSAVGFDSFDIWGHSCYKDFKIGEKILAKGFVNSKSAIDVAVNSI